MNRIFLFLILTLLTGVREARTQTPPSSGVGLSGEVRDVLLPGSLLRVKPDPGGRSDVVLRITESYPHGTVGFRYDLSWTAYRAGSHNLSEYLERVDGGPAGDLPAVLVEAVSVLPPGPPGTLAVFEAPLPEVGGYRTFLIAAGVVWAAGLAGLVMWRRKRVPESVSATESEVTLADRLRLLLEKARGGTLGPEEKARLDRLVLGFWRERLDLTEVPLLEALRRMRDHPEAGALLRQVEEWLHSGKTAAGEEAAVARVLAPYLNTPEPNDFPPPAK